MIDKAPVFATMGAGSHTEAKREQNDFYATDGSVQMVNHIFLKCLRSMATMFGKQI